MSLTARAPASPSTPWQPAAGCETTWRPLRSTPDRYESNGYDGLVYMQRPRGDWRVLSEPGGTHENLGPQGQSDVPAEALSNNRVFVYVDGIHQTLEAQKRQIATLLHHLSADSPNVTVTQPVIAIHQGQGQGEADCTRRMVGDIEMLKGVQSHVLPLSVARQAFKWDKAAQAVHHILRQSLQAGHDVQLMVHSGGGAEVALALQILAREDGGRYRSDIEQHVRILSCSAATSRRDYEKAGVRPDNIFYTADSRDVIYQISHKYIPGLLQMASWPRMAHAFYVGRRHNNGPYHHVDGSFARNQAADGSNAIGTFLQGGAGGDAIFPRPVQDGSRNI